MKKVFIVIAALCLALAGTAFAKNGEILYEYWLGIEGVNVSDLTANVNYPDNPSGSEYRTSFEAPWDWADNYGGQLTGWVVAPETGNYTFYIAADDGADLWLSTNTDPASATQIAFIASWTPRNAFVATDRGEQDNQRSAPISLVQGKKYWIRARNKEGGGGDNLSVGWTGPGVGDTPAIIAGDWLASDPWGRSKATNPTPADGATQVDPAVDLVVKWESPVIEPSGPIVRWDIYADTDPDAGDPNSSVPVLVSVPGDQFEVTIPASQLDYNTVYYWRIDTIVDPAKSNTDPNNAVGGLWQFRTILTLPEITSQPTRQWAWPGESAKFEIAATGNPLGGAISYQWYFNGNPIPGETDTSLSITSVSEADTGPYYCAVTNDAGTINSATVQLGIKELLAWWKLDGDAKDSSGNGVDGTIFGIDPNEMFYDGMIGQAIGINLDARKGEHVVFGGVGITGNMPRTITCWAKNSLPWDQIENWCNIFGFTSPEGASELSFDFNKRADANQYCIHRYGAEWNMGPIDGQWHFLAATFQDGIVRWYFDGFYGGQASTNLQTQDIVHLGKRMHSLPVWQGWVDDARVYNYPLNATEVALLYTDTVTDAMVCVGGNPQYDLNGNCRVDLPDLVLLASEWLECNLVPDCKP